MNIKHPLSYLSIIKHGAYKDVTNQSLLDKKRRVQPFFLKINILAYLWKWSRPSVISAQLYWLMYSPHHAFTDCISPASIR